MIRFLSIVGLLTLLTAGASSASPPGAPGARTDPARPLLAQVPVALPPLVVGELNTPRFRVLYTQRSEHAARRLSSELETARSQFQILLGRDWPGTTELRVALGREEFDALALPGGKPPSWAVALAYPSHHIILVDALTLTEPRHATTLRHELSHVALGQLGGEWPRWFQEGLAMHLSGEQQYSIAHYTTLFRAIRQGRIFDIDDLESGWPEHPADVEVAYAQSLSFVTFLLQRHGRERLARLLDGVSQGGPFEAAFAKAFGASVEFEADAWKKELPARYSWWPILTSQTTMWTLAALICVFGYFRWRAKVARRRELELAIEAAEEAALRLAEEEPPAEPTPGPPPSEPVEKESHSSESPVADRDKPTVH